jgi:hypothetical protein
VTPHPKTRSAGARRPTGDPLAAVRAHVIALLRGGQAHATFERAVARLPARLRGVVPPGVSHSAWQLVEHIRLAQRDILDFSRNTDGSYTELPWPEGFWPAAPGPRDDRAWKSALRRVAADRATLERMVRTSGASLTTPFAWGDGQTLLREALVAADHTAYHVGQLVLVRQLLGAWPG